MEKRVEQQKLLFLSMCSSSDRNKIIGRNSMDIHDFERISYLLGALGFEDYKEFKAEAYSRGKREVYIKDLNTINITDYIL